MKKWIIPLLLLLGSQAGGQEIPYRVVFDVTSSDSSVHQSLLRMLQGISTTNPNAQLEAVFYGQSLNMIKKENTADVSEAITKLLNKGNITFTVCEAAMKRQQIGKDELLAGVRVVPDGVYQILLRQTEGWGYIKVSR